MEHLYFIAAFILLWLVLGGFLLLGLKVARKLDRGDEDGPETHGL